ncbi:MAG: hypothetical protein K2P80_00755 [Beijerinckiaceae bacterium]|nr:hypothetical protein [Beijerinckiaceae bacterium]
MNALVVISSGTTRRERARLLASGLFDPEFYLASNRDLAQARVDPLEHYLRIGWREGRQPSTEFDAQAYLDANPDLAEAGVNPLIHWIECGKAENRPRSKPHGERWHRERLLIRESGLFDPDYYLAGSPDIRAQSDLVGHYLMEGWREGRQPSAEFDADAYLGAYPDVAKEGINPLLHWIETGRGEGRKLPPCPLPREERAGVVRRIRESGWFDAAFYQRQAPWLHSTGGDPVLHYLLHGFKSFLEPSPRLSMQAYLARSPELRKSRRNPLLHFLDNGAPLQEAGVTTDAIWLSAPNKPTLPVDVVRHDVMAAIAFGSRFKSTYRPAAELHRDALASLARSTLGEGLNAASSIAIILVQSTHVETLLDCLDSIANHATRATIHVALIDAVTPTPSDASTPDFSSVPWLSIVPPDEAKIASWVERRKPDFVLRLDGVSRLGHGSIDRMIDSFAASPEVMAVIPRILRCQTPGPVNEPSVVGEIDANSPDACLAHLSRVERETPNMAVRASAWDRYRQGGVVGFFGALSTALDHARAKAFVDRRHNRRAARQANRDCIDASSLWRHRGA